MNLQHAASLTLVVALLGCGSDVQTQGGGGSGTGAGDTGGVSSNGGSSNVGANGTGATGTGGSGNNTTVSSGGGIPQTACEQLCGNVTTCFGADCSQLGVDCTNPQFDCPAECLKDASCADLGAIAQGNVPPAYAPCLQMCQGGGMGGGGTGGGAQGGCQQCAFSANCLNSCFGDSACMAWAQCAQNCQDPACFSMCNAANPNAAMQYGAVYSCMCTSCEMECAAQVDPCNQM